MNIHLSTEFKTEDNLVYQFIPVTSGELNFKVRARSDVHVALTTSPTLGNPMQEVSYKFFYLRAYNVHFVSVHAVTPFYLPV
jgi:hypothetical protein